MGRKKLVLKKPRINIGNFIQVSKAAEEVTTKRELDEVIRKIASGDWGDLPDDVKESHDRLAKEVGGIVHGVYPIKRKCVLVAHVEIGKGVLIHMQHERANVESEFAKEDAPEDPLPVGTMDVFKIQLDRSRRINGQMVYWMTIHNKSKTITSDFLDYGDVISFMNGRNAMFALCLIGPDNTVTMMEERQGW